jgi:ADP-ribose pyrophosphatase YjhB (NUDIX family)
MAQEVFRHIRYRGSFLGKIIFCLYDEEAFSVFRKGIEGYLDYIINKLQSGPFVTVDAIIEIPIDKTDKGIVIIKRSNPPFGWALPGGFVDYGESLEEAVAREAKEETGLDIKNLKQFHTYSDPNRDPRFHTIGTVFLAEANGRPTAGDDACGAKVIRIQEINALEFAFDHKRILQDYLAQRK